MQRVFSTLLTIAGILLMILGVLLGGGGIYLIILGGSWFYVLAAIMMFITGFGFFKRQSYALWVALALFVITCIWSVYEVGFDFWQLVPRVITFLVIALFATLFSSLLINKQGQRSLSKTPSIILSTVLFIGFVGFIASMFKIHPLVTASGEKAKVIYPDAGQDEGDDWSAWGRNTLGNRFAQFTQINKDNVKDLKVAWTYRTGDLAVDGAEYQVTPLKVDDTVYMCTPLNKIIALDATTGKEKWRFDPRATITQSTEGWRRCRGVGYADLDKVTNSSATPHSNSAGTSAANTAKVCRKRIIETTIDARLLAVDAETGKLCEDFGNKGYVDLTEGLTKTPVTSDKGTYNITSAPLVANGVIMVGGRINDNLTIGEPSGVVRGYDVQTGKLLWAWDASRGATDSTPLPPGEFYKPETPNFWGTAAYDPKLNLAYFPTGNQTPDFWTGNRHPYSDEYNDSIVAVDMTTGKEKWHFRTANIDQFDYDVSS